MNPNKEIEIWLKNPREYRKEIFKFFSYLIKNEIRKYNNNKDLYQEGALGLLVAIDKYNSKLNCPFESYAKKWIKCYITNANRNKTKDINLPYYLYNIINQLKKNDINFIINTPEIISKESNIPLTQIKRALFYINYPITLEQFFEKEINLEIEKTIINKNIIDKIKKDFTNLKKRDQLILKLCFGIEPYKEKTIIEIAKMFNLSISTIYSIKYRSIKKLKKEYD